MLPTPIVQLPPPYQTATATAPGAFLPEEKVKLSTLASGGWYDLQARRMEALGFGLTGFWCRHLGDIETLPTGVTDAALAGGGWTIAAGAQSSDYVWLSRKVQANPRTGTWALAWRGSFKAPQAGGTYKLGWFGLGGEGADFKGVFLGEQEDGVGSHTNLCLITNGSAAYPTTALVDANVQHDHLMACNGTTLVVQRDGVEIFTTDSITGIPAEVVHIVARGNAGHTVNVSEIAFGFIES
jgi:hypothetical protein